VPNVHEPTPNPVEDDSAVVDDGDGEADANYNGKGVVSIEDENGESIDLDLEPNDRQEDSLIARLTYPNDFIEEIQ